MQLLINHGVDIDRVRGLGSAANWLPRGMAEIDCWLDERERAELESLGLSFVVIPDEAHAMWETLQDLPARDRDYHDPVALGSALQAYADNFPELCRLYSAGPSYQDRELWVLKITDNPDIDENEPEFKYVSTMHGDEPIGTELLLELIDDLLLGYGSDPRLTRLVNEVEIHIMPMMNPDGNALGTRNNAQGINLNRNFPDPYTSPDNTPDGRAVETGRVIEWTQAHDFDLSANFHTGATLVNYPYDNNPGGNSVYTTSPDDDLYIQMSETYSSTNLPMWNGAFFHGITNGAAWYAISGGMQDWNYRFEGGMEVTVELYDIKWPAASVLPGLWDDNRESMLAYMEWVLRGVRGIVTSSATGLPLVDVDVRVQGRDHSTWSAAVVGDYHRILPAGSWTLEFSKAGYQSQTIPFVTVGAGDATVLDVVMVPLALEPDFTLHSVVVQDGGNGALDPGESVDLAIELSNDGTIPATEITLELLSDSPWLVAMAGPVSVADLVPESSLVESLALELSPDAPLGGVIDFELLVSSTERTESLFFSLSIGLIVEDFESGGFLAWPWQMGGNADWTISNNAYEGQSCAVSGNIGNNQTSELALTVNVGAQGELVFAWKASSEATYDFLRFFLDGSELSALSGETGWQDYSVTLDVGEHTLLWVYDKDNSVSNGDDAGYLDDLRFPPLVAAPAPEIRITPEAVSATLEPGASTTATLLLENLGAGDLDWSGGLSLDDPARTPIREFAKQAKGVEPAPVTQLSSRDAGGPDAFGYSWVDSRSAGGPLFDWVEISGTGTPLDGGDDESLGPFDLGFDFSFYGNSFSSVRVCTNGFLSFSSTATAYSNAAIPGSAEPNNLIAPFWDDLSPNAGGQIYTLQDTENNRFIVQWQGVPHYNSSDAESFQVILHGDGSIVYHYAALDNPASCTVGIENGGGTDGLQIAYNQSGFLEDGLAIRITSEDLPAPWALLSPVAGTVSPQGSTQLLILLDATDLLEGVYTGTLDVQSNDPDQPLLSIPLALTVAGTLEAVSDLQIVYTGQQLQLNWSPVPSATGYRIEERDPALPGWTELATTAGTSWSPAHSVPGARVYRVIAIR